MEGDDSFLDALKQAQEDPIERRPARPGRAKGGRSPAARSKPRAGESSETAPLSASEIESAASTVGGADFNVLDEPLPSERAVREPVPPEVRPRPRRVRRRPARPRPAVRRVKRTVKHINPLSVLKLSLFFYAVFLFVWLAVVALSYTLLDSFGAFETIEEIGRVFTLWSRIDISLWLVERWALFIGLAVGVLAAIVNVALAFIYNLGADVLGGLDMTFVEKDE
ncbi:MAG: DUF3566 domain-containing protein [Actinomycetota bacterium]